MEQLQTPAPLYRDPIYDGATDPVVVYNQQQDCWYMLYTQRRATDITVGVSNIHGTKIGIARSQNGTDWVYGGTAQGLEFAWGHNTFWAPEVFWAKGMYHMYCSYIQGIPTNWQYGRAMIHYSSKDLLHWDYLGEIALSSKRVIDACVYEIAPGLYKMWYKDEDNHSYSYAATSTDLHNWQVLGPEVTDVDHEGPNVFELGGKQWMITDFWHGLGVYESTNFTTWTRQGTILDTPGTRPEDGGLGHHGDVVVNGDVAYLFYFVHPGKGEDSYQRSRTCVQVVQLTVENGKLCCNRNADFAMALPRA